MTLLAGVRNLVVSVCGVVLSAPGCRVQNDNAAPPPAQAATSAPTVLVTPAAVPERVLAAVGQSLDSCRTLTAKTPGMARRGAFTTAAPGSSVTVHSARTFSLIVPKGVTTVGRDSVLDGAELTWPQCGEQCWFRVAVQPDSGIGLEARIAKMVAEQARIDSINKDPRTTVHEFDAIGGPPRAFTTASGRGYIVDISCGDCGGYDLLFERPGQIATVAIGSSGPWPQCEMMVVAKTFTWR